MRKKILIISLIKPFPLVHGGAVAQFFFLEKMTELHDVTLCTSVYNKKEKDQLQLLNNKIKNLNIIYFDGCNNSKTLKYKILLMQLISKINFISKKKQAEFISIPSLSSFENTNGLFFNFLNNHFQHHKYDIIQCEFFSTIDLAPLLPKESYKIFIHHELKFKALQLTKSLNSLFNKYKIELFKIVELNLLKQFNKVVVFNDNDLDLLIPELGNKVVNSPFSISEKLIAKQEASNVFNSFLFIGSESHYPNKDGLKWFLNHVILPNDDKINWPVNIIGNWSKDFKETYKQYKKINFLGFVDCIEDFYENTVLVAPIFSGSGLRTKILQALANKIPVISSYFGAEGLYDMNESEHIILFENENEFLSFYSKIKDNNTYLKKVANNGYLYFNKNYNPEILVNKRMKLYES